ncbi:predicted GPI-anchored protein 58 [Sorghum bicolor]|uniref:predicted GPI-anchored protein 58 n=1 Tax=Sorghum bicolor TaxID=4558 RepID=UPI000B42459D|nr:predicted GPI-anchored protein 58 [Sorghum bicolor]|eukprot:XP_021321778.1 predicted GPI-anchored protein 58 [Sorghum bicolor]
MNLTVVRDAEPNQQHELPPACAPEPPAPRPRPGASPCGRDHDLAPTTTPLSPPREHQDAVPVATSPATLQRQHHLAKLFSAAGKQWPCRAFAEGVPPSRPAFVPRFPIPTEKPQLERTAAAAALPLAGAAATPPPSSSCHRELVIAALSDQRSHGVVNPVDTPRP